MDLLRSAPLNFVLVMNVEENSPVRAQSVVRSLRDAGHHITLFACSARGKLIPVLEDPPSPLNGVNQIPQELLRDKIHNADGVILISDHPPCEVPDCLLCACTQHFNGHMYSWISYGLTCSLLGGLVHNRRVAMQLRWLLEDSQNLLVGRILPRPCYFEKLYSVDPMFETPEPCVL